MTTFLQMHLLISYPPSNLNRDDLGRPKTAVFGGTQRLRISSQSLKRAWRTSDFFAPLKERGHLGQRTRRVGVEVEQEMLQAGISEENARTWSKGIAGYLAKVRKASDTDATRELETEQLVHVSPAERSAIREFIKELADQEGELDEKEFKKRVAKRDILSRSHRASDIAMFGRMLADNPGHNVEAAVQVAHAITAHEVVVEDDFFSAVDDLNCDDPGAGHIGEAQFGAGVFYVYVNVNQDLLLENLGGDVELVKETLEALVRAAFQVGPTGKQNSYGSRCYAHYGLVERGTRQPRQLSLAFLDGDQEIAPKRRFKQVLAGMNRAYGEWAEASRELDIELEDAAGLEEIVTFATEGLHA